MKTFYRPADGHTYWRDNEGAWAGAPTMVDGEVDPGEAGSIVDFDLEIHDIAALNAELNALEQAATDRGHQA
jgi:hypothetical protein